MGSGHYVVKYFSFCDWFNHWSRVNCQIGNQYKHIYHRCTVCDYYVVVKLFCNTTT